MTSREPLQREDIKAQIANAVAPNGDIQLLGEQLRMVLALAQMNEQNHVRPRVPRELTTGQARLAVLVNMAPYLDNFQINKLVSNVQRLNDETIRIDLLSRLLPSLSAPKRRETIDVIWRGIRGVASAETRTQVLLRLCPLIDDARRTPPASFMAVFDIAQSIENREARTRSLIALSQYVAHDVALDVQKSVLEDIRHMTADAARTTTIISLSEVLLPDLINEALTAAKLIEAPDERVRAITALARHLSPDLSKQVQADALAAIEGIVGEERRVTALIAFAPYLEYNQDWTHFPAILERALTVAINLQRHQFRAQALVALANHLPIELKGEALAAVLAIPNEHERAAMLAELVVYLPEDMLLASLPKFAAMESDDARAQALTTLAQYLSEEHREQVVRDAYAVVLSLNRTFERISTLVQLLAVLPDELRDEALKHALAAANELTNQHTRARALNMLTEILPEELLPEAIEIANLLDDPQKKLSGLAGLVDRFSANAREEIYEQMLSIVEDIRHEFRRSRALLSVASLLPQAFIPRALEIAQDINDPYDRLSAIIALAQNLPPGARPQHVSEAWKLIRSVDSGYDRASALAAIAPLLPPAAERDLTHMVGMSIGSIMDEYDQASAIILLAPLLADEKARTITSSLPDKITLLNNSLQAALRVPGQEDRAMLLGEGVYMWVKIIDVEDTDIHNTLWADTLEGISSLPLADAVMCLGQLVPLVEYLAGKESAREIPKILGLS